MSKWPVDNPPIEPQPPGINLVGVPPDPATFDGPLNEFIELHGTAVGYNTAAQTKKDYEATNPPAARAAEPAPTPPPQPGLAPAKPISAGHPIPFDETKFVRVSDFDRAAARRTRPPRYTD